MWTLTVDPGKYESSQHAWQDITQNRRIARLADRMGWNRNDQYWTCHLEWHKSGWPHWHIMLWTPKAKPLYQSWEEVNDAWKPGGTQYQDAKTSDLNPKYALIYVSKYIGKVQEHPTPDWVLDTTTKIRMVSSSKSWGPITTYSQTKQDPLYERNADADAQNERQTHRQAHRECSTTTNIIEYLCDINGEIRARWITKLPLNPRLITKYMAKALGRRFTRRDLASILPRTPEYEHLTRLITKVKMALT